MPEANSRNSSFGQHFARVGPRMDARGAAAHRQRLVEAAYGDVVEIGAGYGATFSFYPSAVTRVLALEPDPTLRALALADAIKAPVPITVHDGMAETLPAADESVDVVVSSLVLCSVTDQSAVLAEVQRVLRPGGLLLFYEHVRSAHRVLATAEDLITPLWSRLAGGCHPNRDTETGIAAAGFTLLRVERFGFSALPGNPRVAHILGAAEKARA
ncbi:class I SAM-dependent methyltransferase [Arthrobacter sp. Y81]|uniref:class I SAM-dependent methyltransferase n=1 Tax=Arthrobacter sp. Y81 TaxID=2058897 RepID=UPI000CE36004|nr:methyltransferase domain-containing protein [Arthrobacter sp. Y81]